MNSKQRRLVIRAISRGEHFRLYDSGSGWLSIINGVAFAHRQGGKWGPYCRAAAARLAAQAASCENASLTRR